ncbi:MAG: hypothetical protein ACD_81C00210G0003 [uncultured bacterium]|uniref:Methyltransferase small domain-containing protein n=1 Tax=Candidatus Wolfebacteria bacterium GW2011_GWC2_39_22 TaxID=1619013 RepID=A0A0G0RF49_9BACT|nr:MAG: hypothetical protein ACD_81C00210G0003 [uncultured bacterium]KKR12282.1 MAG: hypothetical protein UT41_C0002G0056 [Candidatus Wolfebacteria bacterium GW2011_GWC2_39_22]HBI25913.1 hypothetical protein [Candidatus Wolfebacteria bacterium]
MEKINPKGTQEFLQRIKNQETIAVELEGATIRLCKNVFPPKTIGSRIIQDCVTPIEIKGKSVLDVGTGTGIHAIVAAKRGARSVVGIDISEEAVACAQYNSNANGISEVVSIVQSNLFEKVKGETFDVIIANLPFVDYPAVGVAEETLYDSGFALHKRFFEEARAHMTEESVIVFPHANLTGPEAFRELEEMIDYYHYRVDSFVDNEAYGQVWRVYILK